MNILIVLTNMIYVNVLGFFDPISWAAVFDFVVTAAIMAGVAYGVMLLTSRSTGSSKVTPEQDLDFPTAEEGKPIAVLFGTRRLKDPNVVWYGDIRTTGIYM